MSEKQDLLQAIRTGNLERVQFILQQQPERINERTEQGVQLTLLAAYHQRMDIFRYLIQQKKSLSFFEALAVGDLEVVKQRLSASPELLNGFSADGFTPLAFSVYFSQEETADFLVREGADVNLASRNHMQIAPLHAAVAIQNVDLARLLLEKGADVNRAQMEGIRPLHSAVHRGQREMVELLLSHGADPNLAADNGATPLAMAKAEEREELLALLERE